MTAVWADEPPELAPRKFKRKMESGHLEGLGQKEFWAESREQMKNGLHKLFWILIQSLAFKSNSFEDLQANF
jgi:hypothetical protein